MLGNILAIIFNLGDGNQAIYYALVIMILILIYILRFISMLKTLCKLIFIYISIFKLMLFIYRFELVLIYILRFIKILGYMFKLIYRFWLMKVFRILLFRYINCKITSRVKIVGNSKLLFTVMNNCKKGMIMFFYLFDIFKDLFIILLNYNTFEYWGIIDFIRIPVIVNPKSIWIAVIFDNSEGGIIQLIKIFCLKFYKSI